MLDINATIQRCLTLIEKEITNLETKQETELCLDRRDCENLMDYMKVLMTVEKKVEDTKFKTNEELEEAILAEATKIKKLRATQLHPTSGGIEINDKATAAGTTGKSISPKK